MIIAGAGGAAHLPGMTAAMTPLPVLGVPVESKALSGQDSLLSIVQMPAGVPVGTLAIGRGGRDQRRRCSPRPILALGDEALATRLEACAGEADERVAERPADEADGSLSGARRPAATIGILGGGQLGRMLALAAARLGLKTHVYRPGRGQPGLRRRRRAHTVAAYDDVAALAAFAAAVDVVTYEFENVPVAAAELLAPRVPVRPGPRALEVAQDRLAEKSFLAGLGIADRALRGGPTRPDARRGARGARPRRRS